MRGWEGPADDPGVEWEGLVDEGLVDDRREGQVHWRGECSPSYPPSPDSLYSDIVGEGLRRPPS